MARNKVFVTQKRKIIRLYRTISGTPQNRVSAQLKRLNPHTTTIQGMQTAAIKVSCTEIDCGIMELSSRTQQVDENKGNMAPTSTSPYAGFKAQTTLHTQLQ